MNLSKVDLNLFVVFDAIYTEANLTRAGQIVGITQPAVSNALARLRDTLKDPLFVRTAQGMVPTPMARNIIHPVRNALALLRGSVQDGQVFDPAQASKTFRISMTDLNEALILPALLRRLRRQAPGVIVESFLCKRRETLKELAAGHLDCAVDVAPDSDPQVRHVKLLTDRYVCAMRPGHPLAQRELTLDEYMAQAHIQISSRRSGLGRVDLSLGRLGLQRRIALRSQHYLMAAQVVQHSDMLLTVPERFARHHSLHYSALPMADVAAVDSHLYWHESTDQDPANRWIREQIIDVCQQVGLRERVAPLSAAACAAR